MPEIGEIKRGYELGYKSHDKRVWLACENCGKERWVLIVHGKGTTHICAKCQSKYAARTRNYKGANNPKWNNGTWHTDGYIYLLMPNHPRANRNGYVKRAIVVLENKLGRPMLSNTHSHHINGNKEDDRPENLVELSHNEHSKTVLNEDNKQLLRTMAIIGGELRRSGIPKREAWKRAWTLIR